jgi:hypothetical protein
MGHQQASAIKENLIESPTANADHPNADAVRCSCSPPSRRMVSLNHMRANRQPLLHLLLFDARGDGPFGCRAFVLAEFFSK